MDNELIKTQIRSREVIYYLSTENDLKEIKQKGFFADIFTLLFSISIGGIISIIIAFNISESISDAVGKAFNTLIIVFIIATIVFLFFAVFFFISSYRTISQIKESGKIKSYSAEKVKDKNEFEILQAVYWTKNVNLDITEKLRELIVDNRLEVVASNKIDGDPDAGTRKKLTIKYRYNGIELVREYNEKEKISLP